MNISSQTNVSSSVHAEQKTITAEQNSAGSSSKDLASTSSVPSVKVSLSASENAQAASNAVLPPLYSRISVAKNNAEQLYTGEQEATPEKSAADKAADPREGRKAESNVASDDASEQATKADERSKDSREEQASEETRRQVELLEARDREVRAHEQAHKAVGGQYTGSVSLSYQSGPDGKRYAVGGEVPIDVSPIANDPQATIAKMNTVRAAATAPAEPSSQDRTVAALASRQLSEAQADLATQNRAELQAASDETKAEESGKEQAKTPSAAEEFEKIAGLDQAATSEIDAVI